MSMWYVFHALEKERLLTRKSYQSTWIREFIIVGSGEAKGRNVGSFAAKNITQKQAAQDLAKCFKREDDKIESEDPPELIQLPEDFQLVYSLKNSTMFRKHYHYLSKRGFTQQKMIEFRIGVSSEYEFKDRVIFPSFDLDQNLNYYISRSISPKTKSNFRYKNAKAKRKKCYF